jgi:hypothetical protein
MRKAVFDINITADGYCNHTDMIADDEMLGYHTRVLRNASLLLFGRITYQLMVPYWPDVAKRQSETAMKAQDKLPPDFLGSETFQSGVVALHYRKHA